MLNMSNALFTWDSCADPENSVRGEILTAGFSYRRPMASRRWSILNILRKPKANSVVVDLLFNVLPIVCGSSVFVFVLLCITLCPF